MKLRKQKNMKRKGVSDKLFSIYLNNSMYKLQQVYLQCVNI